jgi:CheY-like chemotaxis protein
VKVSDNGRGIAPEHLPHLFDAFSRVDDTLERSHGGLGIGLSLAQRLAAMHGGAIGARSDGLGKGSEFIVRLPVLDDTPEMPPAPAERGDDTPDAGGRVLIVDDNRVAVASLTLLLGTCRYQVQVAFDGQAAVEAAERWRPDAVVLDIGMPRLDGHEACRRIRQQPWGRDMVIIALTGWGTDEDRRKTAEAGFDAHLVKPVEPSLLIRLLAERLRGEAAVVQAGPPDMTRRLARDARSDDAVDSAGKTEA